MLSKELHRGIYGFESLLKVVKKEIINHYKATMNYKYHQELEVEFNGFDENLFGIGVEGEDGIKTVRKFIK